MQEACNWDDQNMVEATQMFSAREIVGIFSLKLAWICICLDSVTDDNQSPIGNKGATAFAERNAVHEQVIERTELGG